MKGSAEQLDAISFFGKNMETRLAKKPELVQQLLPTFAPACRRLTPGPGYLEALTEPKVALLTQRITNVDSTGIFTEDGEHHPVDAIVCATGFDTSFSPRFPIIGRNGLSLAEKWKEIPDTYLAVTTDGFPNYFISLGPNAALGTGNLLLLIEKEIDYFTTCVEKMQRENIRSMTPKREAVESFTKYCDLYFQRTVFSTKCRSWYKGGKEDGRVSALWPGKCFLVKLLSVPITKWLIGSSLHAMNVFSKPRWEDFEYEFVNDNPWGWFGDGWTEDEKNKRVKVNYLDLGAIDFPTPFEAEVQVASISEEETMNTTAVEGLTTSNL